ncbi:cytochrome P450 monooxygenase [Aspergillus coremiiformis]|uniref:Cytochrome P450 monooxygenase n=1 Tax=Aspergillus coremiiformis TaxID=138285 RepID=A0A5N6ZJ63_9EURO|nr:cytochrome P450 monooxygenase [Aspergillus coremiiformis]
MDLNQPPTFFAILSTGFLGLYLLYRALLPKPIPGIPYNEASAQRLLGDVPAIRAHVARTDGGTFITYVVKSMQGLNAPLIQVFIRPMRKPLLVLGDFPEAHDILIRRSKDFDRSHMLGDLVLGLVPDHHIHLKTTGEWKEQRRLVQDLMTPSFLQNVAGPVIHQHVSTLVDLWRIKSRIADGRPWPAADDINQMALDAVMAFAFGEGFNYNATKPTLEAVRTMSVTMKEAVKRSDRDEPVMFPRGKVDDALQATLDLTETVGELQGNPMPSLTWAYVLRRPKIKEAVKIKEEYIRQELENGVERLHQRRETAVESAVDQMIVRERSLAEKDGKQPDYFSRVMIDEIFGFIVGGHDTTSTALCWGFKFLADHPWAQSKLRLAIQAGFPVATAAGRPPTIQEITSTSIPYLDATIDEILRCAGTAPLVEREALVDTEILGHPVPKGTVVACLVTGPSMMSPGFDIDMCRRSPTSQAVQRDGLIQSWDLADMAIFNPDRWIVHDEEKGDQFNPTAGPQLAFGLGTRGCYGKRLAYLGMRTVLTAVVWNFELLPCPRGMSKYHASLMTTNKPKQCYVRLREIIRQP